LDLKRNSLAMADLSVNFYQNKKRVQNHYQNLSQNYDDLWTYSADFMQFLSKNVSVYLELKSTDIFLDLGCGTGLFAKEISNLIKFENPLVCADISADMLTQLSDDRKYESVVMDAIAFSALPRSFDKILVKEMIHHLEQEQQNCLIKNLFDRLNINGQFLLILLPQKIEYPLFEAALLRHQKLQPDYKLLAAEFEKVGFQTEVNFVPYPLSISKTKYLRMVKNRYMSLLSSFSDREIEAGIKEIEQKYCDREILNFNDTFVFILGKKCG